MTKLTFKDVAHYYVGKIKVTTPEGVANFDFTFPKDEEKETIGCYDTLNMDWRPEQVKPHLKRMGDMSFDDKMKLGEFTSLDIASIRYEFTPEAFHYLITKGYNVFGLDESEFIVELVK